MSFVERVGSGESGWARVVQSAARRWAGKGEQWAHYFLFSIGWLLIIVTTTVDAEVGDVVTVITPQPSSVPTYCAIGLAFDGASLYLTRCGDHTVYRVNPQTGNVLGMFDTTSTIPERPAGLAFDGKRNGLWVGTQKPRGLTSFDGCCELNETPQQCADQNREMPIYFIHLPNADVELNFSIPTNTTDPTTGLPLFPGPNCVVSGIAYVEHDYQNDQDDEIWITDNISRELAVLRPNGEIVRGYDATEAVHPSLFRCNGLGIGRDSLYLSNQVLGDVFRTDRIGDTLAEVDQPFVDTTKRVVDMECDPITFAPKSVMWVRTSPQGDSTNDRVTAYEIEAGGCGSGIPIGACCDSNGSTCSDVPQAACAGTWTQGVLCANLEPACFPKHRIILLDRTGSMLAVTSTGETRCERALTTVKGEVEVFFNNAPIGSSVAVWTFAGSEPTQLTAGFVGKTESLQALEALDPLACSNLTPLADSICEAVDFMVTTFPSAPWPTLQISISSDGNENNSDGDCDGPHSQFGTECDEGNAVEPFDVGSWQEKACTKIQSHAVFLATYWGSLGTPLASGEMDPETGLLRGTGVPDVTFFQAMAATTGGHLIVVPVDEPAPSGPSIFGVQGACCLPIGECRDDVSQAECAFLNGTHNGENSTCDNLPAPCPTVSALSVTALALLVAIGGTVVIRRRVTIMS